MKFYLLVIEGDVEPELYGPYDSSSERDAVARRYREKHGDEDGLFRICGEVIGRLEIDSFSGMELL